LEFDLIEKTHEGFWQVVDPVFEERNRTNLGPRRLSDLGEPTARALSQPTATCRTQPVSPTGFLDKLPATLKDGSTGPLAGSAPTSSDFSSSDHDHEYI
jgi:hypothetical protein